MSLWACEVGDVVQFEYKGQVRTGKVVNFRDFWPNFHESDRLFTMYDYDRGAYRNFRANRATNVKTVGVLKRAWLWLKRAVVLPDPHDGYAN